VFFLLVNIDKMKKKKRNRNQTKKNTSNNRIDCYTQQNQEK